MIGSILRKLESGRKLRILTIFCHERYDELLCKTGHSFFSLKDLEGCRNVWNQTRSKIPDNYSFVSKNILDIVDFDLILCGNSFAHLPILIPISKHYNIPIIALHHTMPPPGWNPNNFQHPMFGACAKHVFISEYSSISWTGKVQTVIDHTVETDKFIPMKKENYSLMVCNELVSRDAECGWKLWNYISKDTPRRLVGDTPGVSVGAASFEELLQEYGRAGIYLNTSLRSPIPCALIEGGSAGAAVISTATASVPEYFTHNVNALLFSPSKPNDGIEYLHAVLEDESLRNTLGAAARKRVQEFTLEKFIQKWNRIFYDL